MPNFCEFFWPIHRRNRSGCTTHLIFLGVVFFTTMIFDNVSSFFVVHWCSADLVSTCPRFFINSHNAQFHCIKGKSISEDIFIRSSFWSKNFLYPVTRHKKPISMPKIFLSFFSSSDMHQSHYLNGCQFIYLFIYSLFNVDNTVKKHCLQII